MTSTLTFSVSDMHLGRGNGQDNFRGNGAVFRGLCADLSNAARDHGLQLVTVLNGDIVDMWEIVPDEELVVGPGAYEAIRDNLLYPLDTAAKKDAAAAAGEWQLRAAFDAHPDFVEGLKTLMSGSSVVRYVFGNHDHGMVQPAVQEACRGLLAERGCQADPEHLVFEHFYGDLDRGTYFEHGNQLAGGDSKWANPDDWETQAAGYYFLRFVWNRLEAQYGLGGTVCDQIRLALKLILYPEDEISRNGLQYLVDYFRADKELEFPLAPSPADIFRRLYDDWDAQGAPSDAARYRPHILAAFRDALEGRPPQVTRGLPGAARQRAARGALTLPGKPVYPGADEFHDAYWQAARERFETASPPFPRLQEGEQVAVYVGHTHEEVSTMLLNEIGHASTCRYLNTGTWSRPRTRLVYGFALPGDNPRQAFGLKRLP